MSGIGKHLFVAKSANRKLGSIACTYVSLNTCPDTCALKCSGCYAEFSYARMNADRANLTRGQLLTSVAEHMAHKRGQLIRFHVTGDLDIVNERYPDASWCQLVAYNKVTGPRNAGWLYTHHTHCENLKMYHSLMSSEDTRHVIVIPSADSMEDAASIREYFPWRIALCAPEDARQRAAFRDTLKSKYGISSFTCPAATIEDTTCADCRVCSELGRAAVLFPAHGAGRRIVNERITEEV